MIGPGNKILHRKQRKWVRLQDKVARGEITQQEALLMAGYAQSTADQQSATIGRIRSNVSMQDALRNAGLDEEFIAEMLAEGLTELQHGPMKLAYTDRVASLLDVIPSRKIDKTLSGHLRVSLGEIIDGADKLEKEGEDEDETTESPNELEQNGMNSQMALSDEERTVTDESQNWDPNLKDARTDENQE
jgi:hypothetical protein